MICLNETLSKYESATFINLSEATVTGSGQSKTTIARQNNVIMSDMSGEPLKVSIENRKPT